MADLIKNSKKAPDFNGGVCLVFRLCVDDYHRYGYVDDGKIVEKQLCAGSFAYCKTGCIKQISGFCSK
ncbi:MAG: phosphatidylserine decarboxylase [Eubacterium sp.]